ncbi:MAG: amidohydrolase family protein [Cyclobacteriaceae bacterium]|nr:amidohydrolase family protein [Cyclobacteriaceae bacterium]
MQKLFVVIVLGSLLFGCSVEGEENTAHKYLLFNAYIVDVVTGDVQPNMAILIDSATISKIGTIEELKDEVPKGQQIDADGKYVIPGLWDMHVHMEGKDLVPDNKALLPVFLAYGITTVRDCASDLGEQVLAWRDEINRGELIGPTIYTAGRKLEGKNSIWKDDLEIENEEELSQMLDKLDDYDVDFVKITENTLAGDLFLKSVKAAHERGYRVSGHVPIDLTIDELVEAGFTSIEHASYMLRLGSDEGKIKHAVLANTLSKGDAGNLYIDQFDQDKATEGYQRLGEKGYFVCPTLIGGRQLAFLDEDDHQDDNFLKYLTKRFTDNYAWRIGRMAGDTPEQKQQRKDRYKLIASQLPYMQRSGINIIAGSDAAALNTYVYPAASLIEELEIFQQSGLNPDEILRSATINGAKYFGVLDKTSTVDPGKVADLVLLNDNPLDNIQAVNNIHAVIAKGQYFDRKALDEMLQQAEQTKIALDKEREMEK